MASSDDIDLDSIDVFQPDALDRAVTGYEENVPLAAQIVAGLTPPGMAIDIAAAGKYGRDAARAIKQGDLGRGGVAAGIAGLSLLGAVPLIGDLARGPKSFLKGLVKKKGSQGIEAFDKDMMDLEQIIKDPILSNYNKLQQIQGHPAILKAEKAMNEIQPTIKLPGFGSEDFMRKRIFNIPGKNVVGYDEAVKELYLGGRTLPYRETNRVIPDDILKKNTGPKIANVVIGPPAAGKSAISNPLAIKYNATVIDADEAKYILPEFAGGVGGNAVHQESKLISSIVRDFAIDKGDNLVIPTIGAKSSKITDLIEDLKSKGYKTNLVLTDIDPDLALVRMNDRFLRKGRLINSDSAEAYKGQSIKTYNKLKEEGVADGYAKIDTTTRIGEPKKIFEDTAKIFEGTGL